jgi:hypothetical protein
MTEDNFEGFLKKTAQTYNAPPARVPREEMWGAIQAKRGAGPRVVYGGGAYVARERRFGTRVWLGAAAAAMLLVATGVGIGRWTAAPKTAAIVSNPLPTQPVVVSLPAASGSGAAPPAVSPTGVTPSGGAPNSRERGTGGRSAESGLRPANPPSLATLSPSNGAPAYQLTAVRHLSEAEALLTSFRTRSSVDQQMDAQLGSWARQLLSNTRLLLDSPVANDPQRRPLLEDLELVLVQIVQLSPGSTPQDRDMIEKTLQQDHVMTRLRTAIPAGSQRGS